jgi:carboxypeptidase Q
MHMRKISTTLLLCLFAVVLFAQEKVDLEMVKKIRQEGLNNSKVMDYAFYLTDVNGPRLAGSPGYLKAANWAKGELSKIGLTNAALEAWGEFGKGWELQKSYVALTAPYYKPLIAYPKAWTGGSNGLKNAEVLLIDAADTTELLKYKGKLKGKVLIQYKNDTLKHSFRADAVRYTDEELTAMANAAPPQPQQRPAAGGNNDMANRMRTMQAAARVGTLLKEWAIGEGAVAILSYSMRGHDGTLFVSGGGSYAKGAPDGFLDIMLTAEDYLSICRLTKSGVPVKLDVDVKSASNEKDTKGYNVVAEIKGSDPTLAAEVVMLGGHLDSWHSAGGATDNAAGSAVMMEAVRILKAVGAKPRRTIRIGLWGGEEQGLHGSRGYVKNHFADPATMELKPEHAKFSSYFNIDNGTGKIRGIYLQGNEKVKDIFSKWLEPFHDLGATTVTISNTGGTDHQSFDAVGLPGFQFIQDPIEYSTRTHHTNMDTYDHLIADDLKQIATIVASFVYHAAMRDEKLPRKELPQPRSTGGRP